MGQLVKGTLYEGLSTLDARLCAALEILEAAGVNAISEHPFAARIGTWERFWHRFLKDARGFTEELLTTVFPMVRRVVKDSFPTLCEEFETLNRPFNGIAAISLDGERHHGGVRLYLCDPDPGQEGVRFFARDRQEVHTRIVRDPDFRFEIFCDGVWRSQCFEGEIGQRYMRFSTLLRPRHDYLGPRQSWRSVGEVPPVMRAVVYDWIRVELRSVFESMCRRYGVEANERDWTFFGRPRN